MTRICAASFLVLFLQAIQSAQILSSKTNYNLRGTIDLFNQGENVVKLDEEYRNVTLVFGNTRDGTTTLVQWLATNGENLIAKEINNNSNNYVIEDGDKIGNSTTDSKTIFPELVVNQESKIAFYDCPAFYDAQYISKELVAKYFIKKVIDHAEFVKIILVVSQSTAGRRSSYINYFRLIENIIQFVKNIENFRDSIAIVVTKVENWSSETKNKSEITNDETLINDLGKLFACDKPLNCNKKNNKKPIVSLIRTLNLKRNDTFSRIGIFRKPVESGRLIETNALLTKCKDNIQNIIQQELKFTRRINNDFAYYPISTKHKDKSNFINDLMKKISELANSTIHDIAHQVEKHYTDLNETISRQISYFANNFKHVGGKFELGKELNLQITNGINALKKLKDIKESNNLTIIVNEIVDNLANVTIPSLLNSKRNISNQLSYWEFLRPASNIKSSGIFLKPNPFNKTAYRLQELNNLMLIDVEKTADKIIKNIATNINSTAREIGDYYETIVKMLEYQEGVHELRQAQNILNDFVPLNTTDQQYITKFLKQIDEKVTHLNIEPWAIDTIKIKIIDSQYMAKYLTYLADLIYPKKINFSQEFGNPFQNITKILKNMEIWYKFLGDLQAQYDEEFGRQSQRKFILQSDVVEFFNELKNKNINCDGIEPTELNESQLEDLNNLISSIKQSEMKLCSKLGEFLITGYNVKLGNYINNDFNLECENGVKISAIKIFAINQVIIDVDLNAKGAQLQISIIAPKWKINEKRKIILDGAPGTSLQSFKTNNCEIPFGSSGEDGEPGLPGGPAGNFIGVGRVFVNSNLLTISANGGDGGTGQDGQNGCPGVDGIPAILKPANIADNSNEHHNQIEIEDFNNTIPYYDYDIDQSLSNNTITVYKIHGSKGGQGGKGGNGGKGGRGGYEGSVKIINLSMFSHNIQLSTKKGNTGKGGKGGDGGLGGKNGDETTVKYIKGYTSFETGRKPSDGRGANGLQGYNNSNDIGIKEPEKPFIPPPIATLINQYKQYLGENLKNTTYKIRNFITTFYKELDTNVDIENSYDIFAIIQEFNNLENQIYQIPVQDGLQLYQNLLNRIKEHLLQLQTNEHKKVLIYLYTTILGKIHYLRESTSLTLVVDVRQYLNHITEYFQFLRDINNRNSTISTINYYEEMYTNNITKRIEEMKNFIHTEVTTKIDEIGKEMDGTIKTLIEKIVESKEREPTYRQEAIVRRLELQLILISKGIINIANITQNALKIMYPKNKSSQFSINTILENEINTLKVKKITNLNFLINDIRQKLKEYEDKFADTFEMIYDVSYKLKVLQRGNESTIENVINLENDFREALQKKEIEMKNDEESTKAMLILKNINREIQLSSFDFNIYDENKQNTKSLDEISKAVEDNDNHFQKLKQYEEKIYFTIEPMLKQVRANTKNYVSRLDSELLILPDTSRWDVKKTLRDVKSYMQQLSNEYNTFENFTCYLEKLDEAVTTLINIYDYIENQEEQKTMMKFMTIIHTPTVSNIVINNYELSNTLQTLEASLTSNTILSKYKLAIKAFKQFVFPFSSHYLNSITSTFNTESENIQDLAQKAIHEVDLLISIIDQYRTSIKIFDKYIHFGEFNSEGHSTSPFYVWKNQKKSKKISDLLSGKSIILEAKICESPTNKYTIKFNSIGIHFKCNNTTLQSIIDEKLKKFEVSIIHSGNSYYRYGDNFFLIPSGANQHIQYSFEMNSKAEPRSRNRVYDKMKSGEFLLSPYTSWKMQLIPCVENVAFDELVPYTNKVDLELIGTGVYITKSNDLDLQVDKFYAEEMIKMPLSNKKKRCSIH